RHSRYWSPSDGGGRVRKVRPRYSMASGSTHFGAKLAKSSMEYRGRTLRTLPPPRSEEHTSELQSLRHLVCRPLLEKKKHSHATSVRATSSTSSLPRSPSPRT